MKPYVNLTNQSLTKGEQQRRGEDCSTLSASDDLTIKVVGLRRNAFTLRYIVSHLR